MKKHGLLNILLLTALLVSTVSCGGGASTPIMPTNVVQGAATATAITPPQAGATPAPTTTTAPLPVPTPTLASSGANLDALLANPAAPAPQVVDHQPASSIEASPAAVVEVSFDQAMDQASVQAAWQMAAPDGTPLTGQFVWPAPQKVRFTPDQELELASSYTVTLGEKAANPGGITLRQAYTFRVNTLTPLQISQVFPADGASDIDVASRVTVMFNRPVVPLSLNEDQKDQPQPLVFSPAVQGSGQWINTSVYVYQPSQALRSNTSYRVTVKAGLKDATGDPATTLAQPFEWQFTTRASRLWQIEVDGQAFDPQAQNYGDKLSLIPKLTLRFLQPMQPGATNAAISLSDSNGRLLPLNFGWSGDLYSVVVTPLEVLPLGSVHTLKVSMQALTLDGGRLGSEVTWYVNAIKPPAVLSTEPADGARNVPNGQLILHFASPMNPQTLLPHVVIKPALKNANNLYYDEYAMTATIYGFDLSTDYEVQVLPGMLDRYGNAMHSGLTIHFSTGPMLPFAGLSMPYNPLYLSGGSQDFFFYYNNIKWLDFKLYHVSSQDFVQYTQGGKMSDPNTFKLDAKDLISEYVVWSDTPLNKTKTDRQALHDAKGQPLQPGFYCLVLDTPNIEHNGRTFIDMRFLAVSKAQLIFKNSPSDTLVWATDPTSGKPLAGMLVKLYNPDFKVLGEGKTDASGLLHLDVPAVTGPNQGFPTRIAICDDPQTFAYASSNWDGGVDPYQFGINQGYASLAVHNLAYLYTDRPLYRPGQPVYFKGILRSDNDLAYSLPKEKSVVVSIRSFDLEVYRQELPISDYGAFNGEFMLDAEATLGGYNLFVYDSNVAKDVPPQGTLSFTVAEYRKPTFQVDVTATPANLLAGGTITASVTTAYYSGGGLKNGTVNWTLRADPLFFQPPADYDGFSFYDDNRDSGLVGYQQSGDVSRIIAQGRVVTGADGKVTFTVPASVQNTTGGQRLTLEVSVNDVAGNYVSARAQVTAHRALLYVGARPKQYVGAAGEAQEVKLVALDWYGQPVTKQRLDIAVSERQWFSVQQQDAQGVLRWVTSVKDIPLTQFKNVVTDDKGLVSVQFTPAYGGVYRALVTTSDAASNPARAAAYLWVAGPDYVPWRQSNDRSFQLVVDKDAYKPGDSAQILIASPFQGSTYALVTVERGKLRQQEVLQLNGNSTLYHLPITLDMAPVVYVSVTVVKGVDGSNPRPAFKVGMAKINVSTEQQALKVEVTANPKDAGPGQAVTFSVKTGRADGKPAPAEVSLGLSDLATLSLVDPNSGPILDYFYGLRSLNVHTAVTLTASMDDFNAQLKAGLASGEQAGGGGEKKGEGIAGVPEVRQNFPDTAFWKADLRTDENGQAQVSVTLPDNLTTWRMDARAATLDTLVGQTTVDMVSAKPLLVDPQTPRFFVAGDEATLGAEVRNNTGQDLSVAVTLDAQGVKLEGPASQTTAMKSGDQVFVTWKVSVPVDVTRADLVFSAKGGSFSDASRPTLGTLDNQGIPVYKYEAPETVGTAGELSTSETRTEVIRLPETVDPSQGSLTVKIEPSLAAGMTDGLTYLESYPYECTEQTVSRFLPNVLTMRALQSAGINDPVLVEKLKTLVNAGLQRLYHRQSADGGWSWWSGPSDDLTTAYVMLGLVEAKASDFSVDELVLNNGLAYLNTRLNGTIIQATTGSIRNRQAFMVYVLARAGQPQVSSAVLLYDHRPQLDLYGRALLAQALYIIDPKDPRLDTLRSDLSNAAILSASETHWQEKTVDDWNWNSNTRSTAMILAALVQIDPQSPLTANAVRWLMSTRQDGHWRSTQETAWTLMALTDWMVKSGDLKANYAYAVALNGKEIARKQVNKDNLRQVETLQLSVKDLMMGEANKLVFARDGASGAMYYTTHLTAYLPVPEIKALDQGVIISRRYFALTDLKKSVAQAALGQILQVQLTISAPGGLRNLLVADPLPAGLEAIDTSLKSSPTVNVPLDYNWAQIDSVGWGWWYFSHVELRDEKVVLSADYLPGGTYIYTYQVRATTAGTFQVIPPTAQEFYFPEVYGRGDGSVFVVK